MSVETQPRASEQLSENQADLDRLAKQRLEQLRTSTERETTESAANRAEAAREVINRPETEPTRPDANEAAPAPAPAPARPSIIPPALNYQHTLQSLQRHLKPVSRSFSRVIHQPVVEATSAALEKTVARPSVLNGALWTAVIVGLVVYLTARTYGFPLSGSLMLFALIAGAIIGGLTEIIWRAFKRG